MLGRSQRFLGIYQYFGEVNVYCSKTLHSGCGVRTLDPLSDALHIPLDHRTPLNALKLELKLVKLNVVDN